MRRCTTPRWRRQLYKLGALALMVPVMVALWLHQRWARLTLQGFELDEFERGAHHAQSIGRGYRITGDGRRVPL